MIMETIKINCTKTIEVTTYNELVKVKEELQTKGYIYLAMISEGIDRYDWYVKSNGDEESHVRIFEDIHVYYKE